MNIRDSRDTDRRYNEYKGFKGYRQEIQGI